MSLARRWLRPLGHRDVVGLARRRLRPPGLRGLVGLAHRRLRPLERHGADGPTGLRLRLLGLHAADCLVDPRHCRHTFHAVFGLVDLWLRLPWHLGIVSFVNLRLRVARCERVRVPGCAARHAVPDDPHEGERLAAAVRVRRGWHLASRPSLAPHQHELGDIGLARLSAVCWRRHARCHDPPVVEGAMHINDGIMVALECGVL
mmetsp:Transcript_133714/g.415873  ORF Transcript_133714/g.415873 Transcript_133714/m.415873 type:complete len:203 (-) Transcript_133714:95-703(-)